MNPLRFLSFLLFSGILCVAAIGDASLLQAPHRLEQGLTCATCHQFPFDRWPGYVKDPANIDDTVENFICLGCHNGTTSAPEMQLHSSQVINGRLADWTTRCVDCHDPHVQAQLHHYATDRDSLYLVMGQYASANVNYAADPALITSTIRYQAATAIPGWETPSRWTAKTGAAGRGLLFIPDTVRPEDAFEIIAADSSTITVAGNVGEAKTGKEFGLIYGQLIRASITETGGTPRAVRFFGPETGYTDSQMPATGVCQVCHTLTTHWTADGGGTSHSLPQDCTSCHKPIDGFKATSYTHTGLSNSIGCANCHTADIVVGEHKGTCTTCHSSSRPEVVNAIANRAGSCVTCHGAYFYSHKNVNALHATKVVYTGTSCTDCHTATVIINAQDKKNHRSCSLCHDSNGSLVNSAAGRQGLAPNQCVDCHVTSFAVMHPAIDHSAILTSGTTECKRCHNPNGTTNQLTVTHNNNCALCHDSQGKTISKAVLGAGDCVHCHGALSFYSHSTFDHSLAVYSSIDPLAIPLQPTTCADCHDPTGVADIVLDVHNNNCARCHDVDGYLKGGTYGSALGGAGNCKDCHGGGYFPLHRPPDHQTMSTVAGCKTCHQPDGTAAEIIFFEHRNLCSSCHYVAAGSTLIGSAAGNINGSNCITCHVGYTPSHFNAPPVAVADAMTVAEGGSVSVLDSGAGTVLANDTDADNDPLTAVLDAQPSHGLLVLNADGTFTYSHDGSETIADSFSYHANDGNSDSPIVVVSIRILPVNDAPVAVADTMTVAEGGTAASLDGGISSVLANDTDVDGDPLTAVLVTGPANGVLTMNPNGTFSYVHNGSETLTDSFTYTARDAALDSNVVTVSITVTPVNDPPVAMADTMTVVEGGVIMSLGSGAASVLTNDTDAENNPLTAILVSTVVNGTLTLNQNGTFIYTHNGGQTSSDSFTYKANDGLADSNIVTVSITVLPVNDVPVAAADMITVVEGGTVTLLTGGAASVLANDSDPDGDALAAILVTTPVNGSLTLNSNGTFFYIHNGSETTTDSFTYKANDSQLDSNVATVSITITPVNDAPTAVADAISVAEGGTATMLVSGAASVLANDTDPEASPLTAILVTSPVNGTLTLNASGTFFYTHNGGQGVTDSFAYKANDGSLDSAVVTVTITVTPVNDAPVAVADAITVAEGGSVSQLASGAASVLINDTDADGDPLTAILVTTTTSGTLTLNANGTFVYIHDGSQTTSDSFTYTANDGTVDSNVVTVAITVTAVNDAPVAMADSITVAEGGTVTTLVGGAFSVLANDIDADGDSLTAVLVTGPTKGNLTLNSNGTFFYTHNGSETISDSFSYKAFDGQAESNVVTVAITVTPVNDAPVAVTDAITVAEGGTASILTSGAGSVLANDTDAEANPLSAILVAQPTNGSLTLNSNGTFSYTHDGGQSTSDSFTYRANDGTADSNVAIVSITITPVNDVPVALTDALTVAEGGTATSLVGGAASVLANDTDADNDVLSAILVTGPIRGNLSLAANGTFSYTHNGSETISDSFTYKANDGQADSNVVTVAITVTPVNDPPVAVFDSMSVAENSSNNILAVLVNDTDPDPADTMTITGLGTGSTVGVVLNNGTSVTYTPPAGYVGTDSFTYTITDSGGLSSVATVTVSVNNLNDPPVAVADVVSVDEDTAANLIPVLINDTDPDAGDTLTVNTVDITGTLGVVVKNSSNVTYTPPAGYVGPDSFSYTVIDAGGLVSNVAAVSITVVNVNDAPVAVADSYIVAEGGTLDTAAQLLPSVLANDSDVDGDPLSAVLVASPINGSLTLSANGHFIYTHNGGQSVADSFTYRATDGSLDSATVTVSITVTAVNDVPVAVSDAITVAEGGTATSLVGGAASVLNNDTDADGNPLTAILVSAPVNGSLTLNPGGTFIYVHNGSETIADSFTYKANDGFVDSNTVTVTITVTPVNDAPVAMADAISVAEGDTATSLVGGAASVLANDSDAEGDVLSATLITGPLKGSLTLSANGTFFYTHNGGESVSDSFTYVANDGTSNSGVVTVSITVTPVNDAPVAVADTIIAAEGSSITTLSSGLGSVLANDTDAESNPLVAILLTSPVNGSLTLNPNGTFVYTHDGGQTTSDSFTYKANDGLLDSNVVTVTIVINAVNDPPVAVAESITVAEGGTATSFNGGATSVLTNDTDADGDVLSAILVTTVSRGSLNLNTNGTFFYTHNGSETLTDSFTYKANDGQADSNLITVTITITPVNDAPVAVADAIVVNEGGTATVLVGGAGSVLANDSDAEGSPLTAVLVGTVSSGSLTLNANGTFSYTHDGGQTTSDSFTYRVNDGLLDSNLVTVTITVNPVNDMPVAVADTITVAEGGTATVLDGGATSVLTNDIDADGDVLSAVLVTNVTKGNLTLSSNGTFSYTHNGGETTTDSFAYRANDGQAASNIVTVAITVTPVNDAPVAVADSMSVQENSLDNLLNVLANDTDPDSGDSKTITSLNTIGTAGAVVNNGTSVTYTPPAAFVGLDIFGYTITDSGGLTSSATVTVDVNNVNDAPNAVADAVSVVEDSVSNIVNVLANDTDPDSGDTLSIIAITITGTSGTVQNNGTNVTYTPLANFTGSTSFGYTVSDVGGLTAQATVTITVTPVNDAPVAVADSYTVGEGSTLDTAAALLPGVLANDNDVDGDPLAATLVSPPVNGSLTLNSDGSFIYTHNGGETVSDSFTYLANDGQLDSGVVTVSITVTPVNDPPMATAEAFTVAEGGTATILAGGATSVLANDSDNENDPLTAVLVSSPTSGSLTLNPDGTFSYTHDGGQSIFDTFTYKANDGTADSNVVAVTITITPVNDVPVAVADSITVAEGGIAVVLDGGATSVLANDTDADGDPLSVVLVSGPVNGNLVLNADGTFNYTHNGGQTVSDSFSYRANDGQADSGAVTVTITVTPVNDIPVATADAIIVSEGGTATSLVGGATTVLANDTDNDNDPLTAVLVSGPVNGSLVLNPDGTFSYTHDGGQTSTDSFSYLANDGIADSNTVTVSITITPVNDVPVAVAETITVAEGGSASMLDGGAFSVLDNDTDADADPLSAVLVTSTVNGSLNLNADGTFSYVHNGSETISDFFTYRANDGLADSNLVTVNITVTPVNDAPVAASENYGVAQGGTINIVAPGVLANDTDAEADPLTAVLVSTTANGTLTLNADGSFSYTHDGGASGSDSFTYVANDGALDSNIATVTINVTLNGAPTAVADSYAVNEDGSLSRLAATGVLSNDSDPEADPLAATLVATVSNGSLTLNADGSFDYVPNVNFNGIDTFTYQVVDAFNTSNIATVTITVNPINDQPVASPDSITVAEGGTIAMLDSSDLSVLLNDIDVDGDTLTAVLVSTTTNGSLTLNADGSFLYIHNGGETASDSFTYRADDGLMQSFQATVTITVTPVNDAPVAVDDAFAVGQGGTLNITGPGVLGNDTDAEGNALSAIIASSTANGSLTLNADGSFAYTHDGGISTSDSFTYVANDGSLDSVAATVTISISGNAAPTAVADSYSVNEDVTLTVNAASGVLANDTDPEADALTATLVSDVANGSLTLNSDGSFAYTPNLNWNGSDSFTYQAADTFNTSNLVTVTITVNPVNDAPVAGNDSQSVPQGGTLNIAAPGVLGNDTDVEGSVVTAVLVSTTSNGALTLNGDGSFMYTHDGGISVSDSFTYVASDGALDSVAATVTITIGANSAPTAVADSYSVNEDDILTRLVASGVLANDTDPEGDALSATLVANVTNGSLTLNANGSFTYTPNADFNGTDIFTYQVADSYNSGNTVAVTITVNPVNDAPVSVADSYTVAEGGTIDTVLDLLPTVLLNDSDIDGDTLTAVLVTPPVNGSLTLNADGTFSYIHNGGETASDSFTYRADDGLMQSFQATVTITVTPVNDAPVAADDAFAVGQGGTLNIAAPGVFVNDTDAEGNALTAVIASTTANGSLTLNADGSFAYTHDGGISVSDSFTYVANDGALDSVAATVTISITSNAAPTAVADSYAVNEDVTLTVNAASGVLSNDTDPESDALTATLVSDVANGSLILNSDGSFAYTPNLNWNGSDSFTYQAADAFNTSNLVTVTITVAPVNDAPVAGNDSQSVPQGGTLNIAAPGVLGNDTDVEGSAVTAVLVSTTSNGSLILNADGSFSYTHDGGVSVSDSFTYVASDGVLDSVAATVTISIGANSAPTAVADSYSVNEDDILTRLAATGVLSNDTDPESDALSATLVATVSNGSLTLNADGSFIYTPTTNFTGIDLFTYQVADAYNSGNTVSVTITVTPVNDAPVAMPEAIIVGEGGSVAMLSSGDLTVLLNDIDVDGDTLTAVLVTPPANGSLTLNADGSFLYTHNGGETTSDSFTYRADDGTVQSTAATVTITVNQVNDAPQANSDSYIVAQGGSLNIAAPGVLVNDTDAEGDALTAVLQTGPVNGSFNLNVDGSFTYTHDGGVSVSDSFTYKANDGFLDSTTVTVTITIGANTAPTAVADAYAVAEDGSLSVLAASGVLSNDTDPESDPLTATLVGNVSNGSLTLNADGSFDYTPNLNFNGSDSFTYQVADTFGSGNIVTVTVTVNPVNDAPVAITDSFIVGQGGTLMVGMPGVLGNDTDVDGDNLSAVVVTTTTNGSLSMAGDGSMFYTHDGGVSVSDSFTYVANDGTLDSNTVTVSITITPNTAPTAVADAYAVDEDGSLSVLAASGVLSNDTDPESDPLTATLVGNVSNGSLTLNADGSFGYTPTANYNGSDFFTYQVADTFNTGNTVTVSITVNPVNDAPVTVANSYAVAEDGTLSILAATGVLANDSDIDGDPLTAVLVATTANGSLTLNADGSFNYAPNADFNGSDSFTYQASDAALTSAVTLVTITVNPVNDAPVAITDSFTVGQGGTLMVGMPGVLGNDTDVDGDNLSAVVVTTTTNGSLSMAGDGSMFYTHDGGVSGSDSFTYVANDGTLDSNTVTVSITITPNTAPTAVADAYAVDEDGSLSVLAASGVLSNDTDPESDPLTATLVGNVSNGSLILNADGSFGYTPTANYNGSDSFTYQVADQIKAGNTVTVTITVNPVNDAPVATADSHAVGQGGTLTIAAPGVLGNDTDIDGDALTAVLVSTSVNGSLILNADGSFDYTHDGGVSISDSFSYKANDGTLDSNTVTVTITITPNTAPTAVADAYAVAEDGTLTVLAASGVLGNDTDPESDPLTATLVGNVSNGSLTLNADGSFGYTPTANYNGSDSFTYQVADAFNTGNTVTVTITVNPVNDAPVAGNDSASVNEDTSGNIIDVLANDTDVDSGDTKAVQSLDLTGIQGALVNNGGNVSYTPPANFFGLDYFSYTVVDSGGLTSTAVVTVTVFNINDQPTAVADNATVAEDSGATVIDVLANDTDLDIGDTKAVQSLNLIGTIGAVVNNGGNVSYTPPANFFGADSFSYTMVDSGGLTSTAVVTVTVYNVNDQPVAVADSYTVDQDSGATVFDVLANDTDIDTGDTKIVQSLNLTGTTGSVVNNGGNLSYTPQPGFAGTDIFSYTMVDSGGLIASASVTVTVDPLDIVTSVKAQWSNNTLSVLATNTVGNTVSLAVDYGGMTGIAMSHVGGNQWQLLDYNVGSYGSGLVTVRSSSGAFTTATAEQVVGSCDIDVNGTYIEAENHTNTITAGTYNWVFSSAEVTGENGTGYLKTTVGGTLNTTQGAQTDYPVNFPVAGTYRIWMRLQDGNWNGGAGDSTMFGVDGVLAGIITEATVGQWTWANTQQAVGNTFTIATAGQHTINLWPREVGQLTDAFIIVLDSNPDPVTEGDTTTTIPGGITVVDPNNCGAPALAWDVITSTGAGWLANTLTVTVANTWADATPMRFDYNASTYDMTWNTGAGQWELTVNGVPLVSSGTAWSDAGGSQAVTVTVNQPPTVVNDTATVNINATTVVNVLANDTDSDGPNALTVSAVGTPTCGSVVNNGANVSFTAPATAGTCSFSYTAYDGINSVNGTVVMTVNATAPFTPISEGFESIADGTSGPWGTPAWTPGDTGNGSMAQYWWADSGGTPSSSTGPSTGSGSTKYVYLETSGSQASDNNRDYYIESPVVNGAVYNITFSLAWNMNVNTNTNAVLWVEAWNGTAWQNVATVKTGSSGDVWTTSTYNLGGYTNSTLKVRVYFRRGTTGTTYHNDIALDNLGFTGAAR